MRNDNSISEDSAMTPPMSDNNAGVMQHTPVPWKFEPNHYGFGVLWNPDTRQEIMGTSGFNHGDCPETWMGEEMSDADRSLIEAAPDLLAALTAVVDVQTLADVPRIMDEARAAIAKARGGVA